MSDKKTKVLLIYPWLVVGGTLTLFKPVVEQLKRRGFTFSAITTRDKLPNMGDTTQELLAAGCEKVQHLTEMAKGDEEVKTLFWKVLEEGQYDTLVLIGSTLAYELLPEIKKRYPRVHIVDQLFADSKHVKSNQQLNRYIDVTSVPSQSLADLVNAGLNEKHAKIMILPHGLHVPNAQELAEARRLGEEALPEAKGKFVVSFFGRLAPEKYPELFIDLVERLRDLPEAFFLMVGDGPERDNVQALIAAKKLEEKLCLKGFVDSIDPLVSVSDVVIVPSRNDGQPVVVLHTMAHSKPVIATAVGSIPIMVKDGETGFLCQLGDLDRFVARTRELYENRQMGQALGQAGFRHLLADFDEAIMVGRYEQAMQPAPKPSKGLLSRLLSLVSSRG